MRTTTHPATPPAAALTEELARPSGAIPNGRIARAAARHKPAPRVPSAAVTVKQPAAHGWACDFCRAVGYGGFALLEHAAATGHHRYSMRETR